MNIQFGCKEKHWKPRKTHFSVCICVDGEEVGEIWSYKAHDYDDLSDWIIRLDEDKEERRPSGDLETAKKEVEDIYFNKTNNHSG